MVISGLAFNENTTSVKFWSSMKSSKAIAMLLFLSLNIAVRTSIPLLTFVLNPFVEQA